MIEFNKTFPPKSRISFHTQLSNVHLTLKQSKFKKMNNFHY